MRIYFDLDDTLIHAMPTHNGSGKGKRTLVSIGEKNEEKYFSLLRPHALELLYHCRQHSQVKMLTTATRDYAISHNEVFNLGFSCQDIIAREDYIEQIQLAYGHDWVPLKTKVDPTAILIDNLSPNTDSSKIKIAYLGINESQYFQIREFNGKDPSKFPLELDQLLIKIGINKKVFSQDPQKNPKIQYPIQTP
jgi:hypothetical protein